MAELDEKKFINIESIRIMSKKIFDWLPFKRNAKGGMQIGDLDINDKTLIGVGNRAVDQKNIFEINENGDILILRKDKNGYKQESIFDIINENDSIIINNKEEWDASKTEILKVDNLGKVVYIKNDLNDLAEYPYKYISGIYIVSMDRDSAILSKLAITSSVTENIEELVEEHSLAIKNLQTANAEVANDISKIKDDAYKQSISILQLQKDGDKVNKNLEVLTNNISQNTSDITLMKQSVSNVVTDMQNIEGDVNQHTLDIMDLKDSNDKIKKDMESVKGEVSQYSSKISGIEKDNSEIKTNITSLTENVNQNASDIRNLKSKDTELESNMNKIQLLIDGYVPHESIPNETIDENI